MSVPSTTLRGHTAPVLCLATSVAAGSAGAASSASAASACPLLLSGSEDGTARLWDLCSAKAVRCIAREAFGGGGAAVTAVSGGCGATSGGCSPVTAVAFHSTLPWIVLAAAGEAAEASTEEGGGVTADASAAAAGASASSSASPVFPSAPPAVSAFDLRASSSIVVRSPSHRWSVGCEEVAALRCSDDGEMIAAADDAGDVRVLKCKFDDTKGGAAAESSAKEVGGTDAAPPTAASSSASSFPPSAAPARRMLLGASPYRSLVGHHSSLCSGALFRPRPSASSPVELWSGGLDCAVLCCDLSSGRVTHRFSTQAPAAAASSAQALNPPFVNALAFTPDGRHLWSALGSAELLCIDAESKRERIRLTGHTHALMHCSVVTELPSTPHFIAAFGPVGAGSSGLSLGRSSVVLTAGNDRAICLWDMREPLAAAAKSNSAVSASASSVAASSSAAAKNRRKREKEREKKAATAAAAAVAEASAPGVGGEFASSASSSVSVAPSPLLVSPFLPPSLPFSETELRALADSRHIRYRWKHPRKINAVATCFLSAADDPTSAAPSADPTSSANGALCVLVADTSPDITAYWLR